MIATARYELLMMLRKRSMWISMAVIVALLSLLDFRQVSDAIRDTDARGVMTAVALLVNIFLPVGYGSLLADRLVRDQRLGVAPILDATGGSASARLFGKYVGVCAAAAVPLAIVYFGFAGVYAVVSGRPAGLAWALAAFAVVLLPAVLFVGAFALAVPLVLPASLFRVLFVGYWFWGNAITPDTMPTLANSLVSPIGGYPMTALLGYRDVVSAGPTAGASLNFLRPEPTPATAWLSIAVLLALAALALSAAHAIRTRTSR
jgi:ABC-type transport system involved in multi-copper enzyme maturation permease subunit